jgi:ATP-dependent Clp protease ATP-binding subunit ClpC
VDRGPFELDPVKHPLLSRIGRNLSAAAAAGEIDPVIGRGPELDRLLDVLGRRRANNPVLVGPPGVGKTAIVEGLALRMQSDAESCGRLAERIIIEVSAGALVSGTGIRGALAERLKQLREEVARADGKILLFLDEIHAIVGGEGPDDLANELKAALARGELPCIGATTEAEYRRYFERDAALARRFSRIEVGEPTPSDALEILRGIVPKYELHHAVAYDPPALKAAVELSVRYVPEGFLPDKAIAILDLAAARVRRRQGCVVDTTSVAHVVAEQTAVPVERLLMRDAERLLRMESHLRARVVGQREPLSRIADALRKGAAGFRGRRPLGTFLLLGPTGVGKTETAKAVADQLFPTSGVTRFDMSEFSEPHAVARLLGAPPGYVGHEDGGQLTESVRRRPYQLVLLDLPARPAGRDREGASGGSPGAATPARRGAAHRRARAHRRLHEHRDRDDLKPRRQPQRELGRTRGVRFEWGPRGVQ